MTHQNGKSPWVSVGLLLVSLVYLPFEFAFNAKLLTVASSMSTDETQLHAVEVFGRSVSGAGFALVLVSLFAGDAWRLSTLGRKGLAIAALALCAVPFLVAPGTMNLTLFSLAGFLIIAVSLIKPLADKRPALVILGLVVAAAPSMYHGQKVLFDHYLVNRSDGMTRLTAAYVNLLKVGLRNGVVELVGVPLERDSLDTPEAMTFLTLLGGLAAVSPDILDIVRHEQPRIASALTRQITARELDGRFADYAAKRDEFIQAYWTPYVAKSQEYLARRRQEASSRPAAAWTQVDAEVEKGWRQYADGTRLAEEGINRDATAVSERLNRHLESRQNCTKQRTQEGRDRCYAREHERYYKDRTLHEKVGQYTEFNSWCEQRDATPIEAIDNALSLPDKLLAAAVKGAPVKETQYFECDLGHAAIKARLTSAREPAFVKKYGYPFGLDRPAFRTHPETSRRVRETLSRQGIRLPANWTVAQRDVFMRAVAEEVSAQADANWDAGIRAQAHGHIPANLDFDDFVRHPVIKEQIRARLGADYTESFNLTIVDKSAFAERFLRPAVERRVNAKIASLDADADSYAEGGPRAEEGRNAVRSALIPPISLTLSLFFAMAALVKNGVGVVMLAAGRLPVQVARGVRGITWAAALTAILVPPFVLHNGFSESPLFRFYAEQGYKLSKPITLGAEWIIRMQPVMYPIGAAFLVDRGYLSEGLVALLDPKEELEPAPRSEPTIKPLTDAEIDGYAQSLGRQGLAKLQGDLAANGVYRGTVDGLHGPGTRRAIRDATQSGFIPRDSLQARR